MTSDNRHMNEEMQKLLSEIVGDRVEIPTYQGENQRLETHLAKVATYIRGLRAERDEYREQARRDGMTGFYNRAEMDRLGGELLRTAYEAGGVVSLVLFDIDHFKKVNDTWGHPAGDGVLREVAERVRQCSREYDQKLICRYGGEEFGWFLPDVTLAQALTPANRVREEIERRPFQTVGSVTVSLGVAEYAGEGTFADLLKRADEALYKAKGGGRNQVQALGDASPLFGVREDTLSTTQLS